MVGTSGSCLPWGPGEKQGKEEGAGREEARRREGGRVGMSRGHLAS